MRVLKRLHEVPLSFSFGISTLAGTGKIFERDLQAILLFQLRFQHIAQIEQEMSVQTGIIQLRRRQRSHRPICLLMAFIHFELEFLCQQVIQSNKLISQNTRRMHGVEQIGKLKAKITPQANQVIFCRVKDLFDVRIAENGSQRHSCHAAQEDRSHNPYSGVVNWIRQTCSR